MKPTIGRIVHYKLTETDAERANRRRHSDTIGQRIADGTWPEGAQAHAGNRANAGDVAPALIVRVLNEDDNSAVNLQAFLDGNDVLWVTSATCGESAGQFAWPKIEKPAK